MKAVLLSIRPNWCKLIWSGIKTIEVRKTRPKLETPFKVYIYCTREHRGWIRAFHGERQQMGGHIVGEFTCSYIAPIFRSAAWIPGEPAKLYARCADGHYRKGYTDQLLRDACLNRADVEKYFSGLNGLAGYGWKISDLKIYDKPRELRDFTGLQETRFGMRPVEIQHPPQSWRYVEELECT